MSQSVVPAVEEKQLDTSPTLTFEEYRVYQSKDDVKYELYKGKLIPMATASALHTSICEYWVYKLQRYLAEHNLDLVVKTSVGVRTEDATSRIPDVVVCTQSLWEQALARPGSGILGFDETPLLVIEVVSQDRRADYITKRGEYQLANVPEYVIVDPSENRQRVRVMAFLEGDDIYTEVNYLPGEEMVSVVFPNLRLSVNEILDPPLVEGLIKAEQAQLQKAERLAARLRELGVDPDSV
ncbi:Uma2 family endonuclease [Tychonema sp. LEGE 07199]|uniref:Uma2 family endonuclease n=1 Tax=unclassified Tychonema TaxID=2642144 RepID=UPI00188005CE|nr:MULTISPECIES: Uma2 family endonuclease [unclassified Tychonema]MBE9124208.1 Uma2 family endonuclease [Tychonema sp. LEGE 07199]MBE9135024.1 Uma2 family endonuclease [Tychonema sp. LEGE 07196]